MKKFAACFLFFWTFLFSYSVPAQSNASHPQFWKSVAGLLPEGNAVLDPRTDTPRSTVTAYLPADPYQFEVRYTTEELGYRSMEFARVSRWLHVMADAYGSMTNTGYFNQGITIGLNFYMPDETGIAGQLEMPSGEDCFRMVFYYASPAELLCAQDLWILHRTDDKNSPRLYDLAFAPSLRRVRRIPQPRRGERFSNSVQSFDDIVGSDA